jgi:metal-responsive CopG/Arc/MetJ family transcriptional regulator
MKVKASISVSEQLLKMIDRLPQQPTRSEIIEEALVLYFRNRKAIERDRSDLDIFNQYAKTLNEEALDALDFQTKI